MTDSQTFGASRVPTGVPTGGQFAAGQKAEADVSLAKSDTIEALGDLNLDQQRLLAILLNPENSADTGWSSDPEDIVEEFENFGGYLGCDSYSDAQHVADLLHAHYNYSEPGNPDGAGDFTFGYEASTDGEISSYTIGVYLGHRDGAYLTEAHETKYLANGDRSATGLRAALNYAQVLDGDYQRILAKARRNGLVPDPERATGTPDPHAAKQALAEYDRTPEGEDVDVDTMAVIRDSLAAYLAAETSPRKPVWATTDHERSTFPDWQYEIANGDTAVSFRDWYENRYQGAEVESA